VLGGLELASILTFFRAVLKKVVEEFSDPEFIAWLIRVLVGAVLAGLAASAAVPQNVDAATVAVVAAQSGSCSNNR